MTRLTFVLCGLALLQLSAAINLYSGLARDNTDKNIVYSAFSVDSALTLAYMGAGGHTAEELRSALKLSTSEKTQVGINFRNVLHSTKSEYPDAPIIKIANRFFVDNKFSLAPSYNEVVGTYFDAQAEAVNFGDAQGTAQKINSWVAKQTENTIKDLISPDSIDESTMAAILNAVYFKAFWQNPFHVSDTKKQDFHISASQKVPVDMMSQEKRYHYAELSDLNAKVVALPYYLSDISMWIVLPNEIEGFSTLHGKMSTYDWSAVKFQKELVDLKLPKFKFDFGAELKPYLIEHGIKDLFDGACNLSELFLGSPSVYVTQVAHKAFIEVNEKGTEAAGATAMMIGLGGMYNPDPPKQFYVDRPFIFAIRDAKTTYFAGHVVKF